MRVVTYLTDVDGETTWAYVENQGRACWYGIKEEIPDREELTDAFILAVVERDGFDPAALPHIEDQNIAVQRLWHNTSDSENCMWYVDVPDYYVTDGDTEWAQLGITQEEFERQVDAVIEKYHLEDIVVKNNDDSLYTCYGDLQNAFSEEYVA